eukprot:gene7868-10678_t
MNPIIEYVVDLIFKPGSSLKLVPAINITVLLILLLMAVLLYQSTITIPSIHIIIMSSLAVGLLLSVNWFYYEFKKITSESNNNNKNNSNTTVIPKNISGIRIGDGIMFVPPLLKEGSTKMAMKYSHTTANLSSANIVQLYAAIK